ARSVPHELPRGAERLRESHRDAHRESMAPVTRPAARHEQRSEPAFSRRPTPPSQRGTSDHHGHHASGPLVRESISFPAHIDTDWDTPAFQRRQSGS
ncbi:MAG TPA: hypothetical protein VF989_02010, partial [Polyangiaceae bacterium]